MTHGTAKLMELEAAPFGAGFTTVMASGPAAPTALAGTAAVMRLLLTNAVGKLMAFSLTVDPDAKFVPTTLSVNAGPPWALLFGDRAVTEGVGPALGGGAVTAREPPHALRLSALNRAQIATPENPGFIFVLSANSGSRIARICRTAPHCSYRYAIYTI